MAMSKKQQRINDNEGLIIDENETMGDQRMSN